MLVHLPMACNHVMIVMTRVPGTSHPAFLTLARQGPTLRFGQGSSPAAQGDDPRDPLPCTSWLPAMVIRNKINDAQNDIISEPTYALAQQKVFVTPLYDLLPTQIKATF